MPDYGKGKIYAIHNTINDMIYGGSTVETLANRFSGHKKHWKRGETDVSVFAAFIEHGIENFYIELVKNYACENREQLNREEGIFIRSLGNKAYNKRIEGRTQKEYYQDNKEAIAVYRANNKESIAVKDAARRANNKEKRAEYDKAYYQRKKAENAIH